MTAHGDVLLDLERCRALAGILSALEDHTDPLTTCWSDGCLCRPSERCPACRARRELSREVS